MQGVKTDNKTNINTELVLAKKYLAEVDPEFWKGVRNLNHIASYANVHNNCRCCEDKF